MNYPIGIQDFAKLRENNFVYVDKTDMVFDITKNDGVYFLSRPRRFGKSLLVSTIKYYFEGRHDLFKGLKIESLEKKWETYPVFEIDFNGSNYTEADALEQTLNGYLIKWEQQYGVKPATDQPGRRLADVLHQAHVQTGKTCVVLVDEYDKPMLDAMDTGLKTRVGDNEMLIEDHNRETLKAFYSVFKLADADLRFVFLTGVTKFAQVSVFSGFNNAQDISMSPRFDAICGITTEELNSVFAPAIEELANANAVSVAETKSQLKQRYDGYHFSKRMTDIYNPFSLLNTFKSEDARDYWFASGTPSYLMRLLAHSKEDIQGIIARSYEAQEFVDYRATVEAPVPMIYQSGYLTIKGYNREDDEYKLDFPNHEVASGFLTLLASGYFQTPTQPNSWANKLKKALHHGKPEDFRDLLNDFLASIPYSVRESNSEKSHERQFQYTVYLIMRLIGSTRNTVYHEKATSKGRADCVIETPRYVYIFEYKLDRPAAEAMTQIGDRGYADPYAHDGRPVYAIACSFSSETGTISDWMVKQMVGATRVE
ncbi:ATP-binding protein [Hallella mizrahii]|uniref:AAA family ATPase n=1 Tax=Hallella mizrahii TaxID=2606637 RepID=A0A7K0KHX5_9BACT|nr:ATP-binding protein [Hallella mizrahii]MST85537.1 AAA family ATPase [Hallella mizrahii]